MIVRRAGLAPWADPGIMPAEQRINLAFEAGEDQGERQAVLKQT